MYKAKPYPSRHTTSFQRLYDVYTTSLTLYRRRIYVETTSCIYWDIDKHSLLSWYHSFIHSCINYGNIAWVSTIKTNLKKICSQQKHAIRIVYSKDRLSHTRKLFKQCKVLNVYQVNIWKNLVFMRQINSNTVPTIFLNKFKKSTHNYPTNFAGTNYSITSFKLNKSKYRISIRGPTLRKNIPHRYRKKATKDQYL